MKNKIKFLIPRFIVAFIVILIVILYGCHCTYKVTKDYLKSSCRIYGFQIRSITPKYSTDSIPFPPPYHHILNYVNVDTLVELAYYTPRGELPNTQSLQRKIYFKQPLKFENNEGYRWEIKGKHYEMLPINFLPLRWYLIMACGSNNDGLLDYYIFIYVDEKGKFKTYYRYSPGPF